MILSAIYLAGGGHVKTEFDMFRKDDSDVGEHFHCVADFLNLKNRSPTSQTCHQQTVSNIRHQ